MRTIPKVKPADILCGQTAVDGATLITIPANRVWKGWISLSCGVSVAASGAAVTGGSSIALAGSTATPAAGTLLRVIVSVAAQPSSSAGGDSNSDRIPVTIAAGASAATLTLVKSTMALASAQAMGELIA